MRQGRWPAAFVQLALVLGLSVASYGAEHPRAPPRPPPYTIEPTPTPEEWLARLVGRFKLEGVVEPDTTEPRGANGPADCASIGTGAGVQCIQNVAWIERWSNLNNPEGVHPYLDPSVILYGFEPATRRLQYLLVDRSGIAQGGTGVLKGGMATFRSDPPRQGSVTVTRIYAPASGKFVQTWISRHEPGGDGPTLIMLYGRRLPEIAQEAPGVPQPPP